MLKSWFASGVTRIHDEPMRLLIQARNLETEMQILGEQTEEVFGHTQMALRLAMVRRKTVAGSPEVPGADVTSDPERFHRLLRARIRAWHPVTSQWGGAPQALPELDFHIMAENITFRRFRRMNPHLRVFDNIILGCARRAAPDLMDPERVRPRSQAQQALRHFDVFDPPGKRLLAAFAEDCDPMTKLLRIRSVIRDFGTVFVEKFFGRQVAGEDDIAEVRAAFFARYASPVFTSVIVFLHDFVVGRGNASEALFAEMYPGLADIAAVLAQLLAIEKLFFEMAFRREHDQGQKSAPAPEITLEVVRPFWSISRYANRSRTIAVSGGEICRAAFSELIGTTLSKDIDEFRWQLPVADELAFSISVRVVRNPAGRFPPCDLVLYVYENERDAVGPWFQAAFDRNPGAGGWVVCNVKVRGVLEKGLVKRFPSLLFTTQDLERVRELAAMIQEHVTETFEGPIAHPTVTIW
jgi:hypothetical protein